MEEKKTTRERQSTSQRDRQQAFENTAKLAREAIEEERRRREEKNERLRVARLTRRTSDGG